MKPSLRRTLALRFAATMAAGLVLATGAFYWSAARALQESVSPAVLRTDLVPLLASIVVAGTAATLMGAWHFTSSAVRPVAEITAQATGIEAGTLDERIVAPADTEESHSTGPIPRARGMPAPVWDSLVAAIAHLHGGVALVSSVLGRNTRFEVDIPTPHGN